MFLQDLKDATDMGHMLRGGCGKDDDIIKGADRNDMKVLSKNIVHKILEPSRRVSGTLWTDLVFKVSFTTSESSLSFIPLLNMYLMISIFEVNLSKYLGQM